MAVNVAYDFIAIKPEFIANHSTTVVGTSDLGDPDILALADGGFGLSYEWSGSGQFEILQEIYAGDGTLRSPWKALDTAPFNVAKLGPSVTQLAGGGILTTWTQAGSGIRHAISNPATGLVTTADTLLGGTDANDLASDVAALQNGGFVVVKQENAAADNQDADILFYNSAGVLQTTGSLGENSSSDEQAPAVAVLDSGNVVVAFEKEQSDGGNTFSLAIEIYSEAGAVVVDETIFDIFGTVNIKPDVLALDDGGFVVGYDDNGWGEQGVTLAFFDSAGNFRMFVRADNDAMSNDDVKLAKLANGFVVATWTDNGVDIHGAVIDPATLTRVGGPHIIEDQNGQQEQSSVAALADGRFVTAWRDYNTAIEDGNTDPAGSHVSMQIDAFQRTSTGDGAADTLGGDKLIDIMTGNGGNDTYYVDNLLDQVIELAGQGIDSVRTTLSTYTIAANVERLYNNSTTAYTAVGNALNNTIYGNNGDDRFRDYAGGADAFSGGNGLDAMYYSGTAAAILNFATNVHGGSAAGDAFASVEKFFGSSTGNDQMTAGAARATFNGQGGNDTLTGGANHDKLYGEAGTDTLSGGGGNDQLYGGLGNDTMTGGALRDDFIYTETVASGGFGADTVTDWQDGLDVLRFANAVADAFGDFTIANNNTSSVTLTLIGAPANTIILNGAGPINISAADFQFF
jgi:RTX calcium-binding nonapeptide repeat (4 copies)